ncbi:MAG: putative methyltransferase [Candidatus Brocadiaceae bacterium]|nr:putative methyltransferase [Candidatus Brocadiaceae bacterium]
MQMNNDYYSLITESPGLKASKEQVARLYQRYHFARQFAEGQDVLEVACGSGIGLGYLAEVAKSVVGLDIDEKNVDLARKCCELKDGRLYREDKKLRIWEDGRQNREGGYLSTEINGKIRVDLMDAHTLDFSSGSFGLVLLYEAVYYLKEPQKFVSEAERVLRENGELIICTVNKDWNDFHPSPYTHKYFSVSELYEMLRDKFNHVEMYGGFPVNYTGMRNKIISFIKRMAVDYNLIPGSLKARAYLKRVFMGKLVPLPAEVYEDMAPYEPPVPIAVDKVSKEFKIIYAVATK